MLALFFITLMSLILRVIGIVKPDGLWNDEYISWQIAATPFNEGFIKSMWSQCHMPFYYLYLKMCMALGGSGDTFLRLTSLIPGVLSVIVMYFVGLQINKKTAVLASVVTALSSFLIYYSQEVRLYSLLFLISAFSLLYFLKYIKTKSAISLLGLLIFNFIIMFTHTIGFVFVFFELLALSFIIYKQYKKQVIYVWLIILILFGILAPNMFHIMLQKTFSQWWGTFSISKLGFLFTDYFSPILTNLVNAPDKFLYNKNIIFLFFLLCPTIIALVFIGRAVYKNKENRLLFAVCIGVITVMAIAAIMGKLVFITKYSIEIYPILIFLVAYGAASLEKNYAGNILMSVFCLINLWYLVVSPVSAPKKERSEGHKIVANLINNAKPSKDDFILLQYYGPDRFYKYIDFSDYNVISINKGNFNEYLTSDCDYDKSYTSGKEIYKPIFSNPSEGYFESKLQQELDNLHEGQSVIVIINDSVAFYKNDILAKIAKDDYVYEKIPLMFMIFSYISNHTFDYLVQNAAISRVEKAGSWSLVKFTKLKNSK